MKPDCLYPLHYECISIKEHFIEKQSSMQCDCNIPFSSVTNTRQVIETCLSVNSPFSPHPSKDGYSVHHHLVRHYKEKEKTDLVTSSNSLPPETSRPDPTKSSCPPELRMQK